MDDRENRLKRECNVQGGALLIYRVIMSAAMVVAMVVVGISVALSGMFDTIVDSSSDDVVADMSEKIAQSMTDAMGWGYLLAIAVGLLILLLWKKPAYIRSMLTQRGKPMKVGEFFAILAVFLSVQFVTQVVAVGLEAVLNCFDLSLMEVLESSSANMDSFGMLLYIGIAAPITEELLFRGLILRSFQPYGKGFAICLSAILFGFFHGSPIQTPFALLIGLILGYVAVEYNIIWAMVLHLINNLILGDTLPRLLSYLPYELPDLIMSAILVLTAVAAAVIAWVKRRQIPGLLETLDSGDWQWRCVLRSPCILILIGMCLFDMFLVAVMMILM